MVRMTKHIQVVLWVLAVLAGLYGIYIGVGQTHAYAEASFFMLLAIALETAAKLVT